ncbi:MAG: hypothetical protein EOP11_22455 [Proteobacteria bacterium]|nr:MAG: hypothetical protein EOP11_22455 [Pseudomonadota bacterium]
MRFLLLSALGLVIWGGSAGAAGRNMTQDMSCADIQAKVQRPPYRQSYIFWRDGDRTRFDIAYAESCPVPGFRSLDFTVESLDNPQCTVGVCCVADSPPECGGV